MTRRTWTSWLKKQGGRRPWIPSCSLSWSVKAIPWGEKEKAHSASKIHTTMCTPTKNEARIYRTCPHPAQMPAPRSRPSCHSHMCDSSGLGRQGAVEAWCLPATPTCKGTPASSCPCVPRHAALGLFLLKEPRSVFYHPQAVALHVRATKNRPYKYRPVTPWL